MLLVIIHFSGGGEITREDIPQRSPVKTLSPFVGQREL